MSAVMVVPAVPDREPHEYRAESAPVLIRTRKGGWYTARWVEYEDDDMPSAWELIGLDGYQLERGEVDFWCYCAGVLGMIYDVRHVAQFVGSPDHSKEILSDNRRILHRALDRVGGAE